MQHWNALCTIHCALCRVNTLQSHWSAHSQCKQLVAEVERGKCREERGKPRVECKKVNGEEEIEGSHGSVNLLLPSSSNSIIATVILFINTDSVTVTISSTSFSEIMTPGVFSLSLSESREKEQFFFISENALCL